MFFSLGTGLGAKHAAVHSRNFFKHPPLPVQSKEETDFQNLIDIGV